jgi:threonine dehydrogenase-like Zn-dependent dehydrogenase
LWSQGASSWTTSPSLKSARWRAASSSATSRSALVTHLFKLDDIEAAYELFAHQRNGVLKVAITP